MTCCKLFIFLGLVITCRISNAQGYMYPSITNIWQNYNEILDVKQPGYDRISYSDSFDFLRFQAGELLKDGKYRLYYKNDKLIIKSSLSMFIIKMA